MKDGKQRNKDSDGRDGVEWKGRCRMEGWCRRCLVRNGPSRQTTLKLLPVLRERWGTVTVQHCPLGGHHRQQESP